MNEIVRIHIAGVPYEIDAEARRLLEKYLKDVKASLGDEADALDEIEIRITEILAERGVGRNDVIKSVDVKAVKKQLGEPKDFAGDEAADGKTEGQKFAKKIRDEFAKRKYFRDTENGIFGGVIAGLAAYTGLDVTLLRVLFVLLCVFTAFFPFLVIYMVVWIVAPEAKTTGDRLSMEGKPVNIETIVESVEEAAEKAAKGAEKVAEDVEKRVENAAARVEREWQSHGPAIKNTGLRVVLAILGIFGFLMAIPALAALVPIVTVGVYGTLTVGVPEMTMFMTAMVMGATAALIFVVMALVVSAALCMARISKGALVGLLVAGVLALGLAIAAVSMTSLWVYRVGDEAAKGTVERILDAGRRR
ncbi:PspC domain-containing protein [Candidatus Saccharibacteria bacterium]|nr:PspC domain-containing protein [Candidatus Saccharibacteria bacterium]